MKKDFLTLADWTREELEEILADRADQWVGAAPQEGQAGVVDFQGAKYHGRSL